MFKADVTAKAKKADEVEILSPFILHTIVTIKIAKCVLPFAKIFALGATGKDIPASFVLIR